MLPSGKGRESWMENQYKPQDDIKIAVFHNHQFIERSSKHEESQDDPAEKLRQHRDNGNLDKVKRFGAHVARRILGDRECYGMEEIWKEIFRYEPQIRLLMCFTALVELEKKIADDILSHAATSSFLEAIQEEYPVFDKFMSDSGDFTLYYLAFRRGGEVELTMGKTFAGLCNADGEAVFVEYGETIFCRTLSWIDEEVEQMQLQPVI